METIYFWHLRTKIKEMGICEPIGGGWEPHEINPHRARHVFPLSATSAEFPSQEHSSTSQLAHRPDISR